MQSRRQSTNVLRFLKDVVFIKICFKNLQRQDYIVVKYVYSLETELASTLEIALAFFSFSSWSVQFPALNGTQYYSVMRFCLFLFKQLCI